MGTNSSPIGWASNTLSLRMTTFNCKVIAHCLWLRLSAVTLRLTKLNKSLPSCECRQIDNKLQRESVCALSATGDSTQLKIHCILVTFLHKSKCLNTTSEVPVTAEGQHWGCERVYVSRQDSKQCWRYWEGCAEEHLSFKQAYYKS